jgi:acyl-CoA reductase-like NAD-dependent aldehyde dehydrogenase
MLADDHVRVVSVNVSPIQLKTPGFATSVAAILGETGVAGIVAPSTPSLLGLVSRLAPALCGGNAVVLLASEPHPLPAVELAECMQTADVPHGVVNILTGKGEELLPWLASHLDLDVLDVTGVPDDSLTEVESKSAENVKRIVRGGSERSPYEATAFMEMKTVWHPKGA